MKSAVLPIPYTDTDADTYLRVCPRFQQIIDLLIVNFQELDVHSAVGYCLPLLHPSEKSPAQHSLTCDPHFGMMVTTLGGGSIKGLFHSKKGPKMGSRWPDRGMALYKGYLNHNLHTSQDEAQYQPAHLGSPAGCQCPLCKSCQNLSARKPRWSHCSLQSSPPIGVQHTCCTTLPDRGMKCTVHEKCNSLQEQIG